MSAISFKDLTRAFGGSFALNGATAEIQGARTTAIIGPNGAGKTTLLNILTGFLAADSGQCFLGERKITGMSVEAIARLGLVRTFQEVRLIRQVSVLENVLLAQPRQRGERLGTVLLRSLWRSDEVRIREVALDWLGMAGLMGKKSLLAENLSYGQQKLLSLAMCLAADAKILLLDEPVAGVDPEMKDRILRVLREVRKETTTIVFIEHDLDVVRRAADEVIVMEAGRVLLKGAPEDVLESREVLDAYVG